MRDMTKVLIATTAYLLIVFPLAFVWHLVLFEEQYRSFGYLDGDPNFPVALLSMLIQGAVLGLLYPKFRDAAGLSGALNFTAIMGLFFWTCHVLGLVAKQSVPNAGGFVAMETVYLALQFGLFGCALHLIYRGAAETGSG